jgi:hypothetical protein
MPFKPADKAHLLSALALLKGIVTVTPEQRKCDNCKHGANGCMLASGRMPPEQVQREGCKSWMWDGVPF